MAINFPDSPVDGQEATLANNTWMYSTSKSAWLRLNRGVSVDSIVDVYANISELPLSGVSAGQQAFVDSSNSSILTLKGVSSFMTTPPIGAGFISNSGYVNSSSSNSTVCSGM